MAGMAGRDHRVGTDPDAGACADARNVVKRGGRTLEDEPIATKRNDERPLGIEEPGRVHKQLKSNSWPHTEPRADRYLGQRNVFAMAPQGTELERRADPRIGATTESQTKDARFETCRGPIEMRRPAPPAWRMVPVLA